MDAVLAIDAGNTRIKWGVYSGKWLANGSLAHDRMSELSALSRQHLIRQAVVSNVAGAEVERKLKKSLDAMQLEALWVTATAQSCGVNNSYSVPQQLGSDRWAALIAAWQLKHAPCVVVNAGTAVTVDALSAKGIFMGGLILPGLSLMKTALAANTAQLQQVTGSVAPFPQNTGDAMHTGAIQAICGAVLLMRESLSEQGSSQPPLLLLTGGDASLLLAFLQGREPVTLELAEHLVLDGLVLIYKEHTDNL